MVFSWSFAREGFPQILSNNPQPPQIRPLLISSLFTPRRFSVLCLTHRQVVLSVECRILMVRARMCVYVCVRACACIHTFEHELSRVQVIACFWLAGALQTCLSLALCPLHVRLVDLKCQDTYSLSTQTRSQGPVRGSLAISGFSSFSLFFEGLSWFSCCFPWFSRPWQPYFQSLWQGLHCMKTCFRTPLEQLGSHVNILENLYQTNVERQLICRNLGQSYTSGNLRDFQQIIEQSQKTPSQPIENHTVRY